MAITVISGLLSSTALSVIYVPAVFTVMDDLDVWARRTFGALVRAPRVPLANIGDRPPISKGAAPECRCDEDRSRAVTRPAQSNELLVAHRHGRSSTYTRSRSLSSYASRG